MKAKSLDVLSKLLEKQVYSKIFGIISPYITQWQQGLFVRKNNCVSISPSSSSVR